MSEPIQDSPSKIPSWLSDLPKWAQLLITSVVTVLITQLMAYFGITGTPAEKEVKSLIADVVIVKSELNSTKSEISTLRSEKSAPVVFAVNPNQSNETATVTLFGDGRLVAKLKQRALEGAVARGASPDAAKSAISAIGDGRLLDWFLNGGLERIIEIILRIIELSKNS